MEKKGERSDNLKPTATGTGILCRLAHEKVNAGVFQKLKRNLQSRRSIKLQSEHILENDSVSST